MEDDAPPEAANDGIDDNATQGYDRFRAELARYTREQGLPVDVSTWEGYELSALARNADRLELLGFSPQQIVRLEFFVQGLLADRDNL